jgi:hypothetical protein
MNAKPPRDMVSIEEFLYQTQTGFREIARAYKLRQPDLIYEPADWAAFAFILRACPDKPQFFPSGKWATIQALEEKLNQWASDQLAAKDTPHL